MASRPSGDLLERALRDLSAHVAFPPEPDLAPRVVAAIEIERSRRTAVPVPRRRPARAVAFGMAVLVAATLTVALSPATREAVADFLGIGGVRIETAPGPLPTPTAGRGDNLALGTKTTLEEARAAVDFDVLVPSVAELGDPDEVYLSTAFPAGGRVSLAYRAGGSLPEARTTGLGLLVTEFEGTVEPELAKKLAVQQQVRPTDVNGSLAFWVRGPHTVFFLDANGQVASDTLRLSANALIWTDGTTTLRIESELNLADTLRIAESMR